MRVTVVELLAVLAGAVILMLLLNSPQSKPPGSSIGSGGQP